MSQALRIARLLKEPVGRLDSIVVPLAAGGRDSHQHPIASEAALLERLSEAIGEARAAIEIAQNELARHYAQA
jgi:hypothetical protein